jgi:phage internal scaffolding protein
MSNFRTQYSHDRAISALFATVNNEDSLTNQSDAKDCDINILMSRYQKTGQMPQLLEQPRFGDFSQVGDYREALDLVRQADATFHEVPAKLRKEFDNDPAKFLEFVKDPKNIDKMREMGLASPAPKPPAPTPGNIVDENPIKPTAPVAPVK